MHLLRHSHHQVPSKDWWVPHPAKGAARKMSHTHDEELEVFHSVSSTEPGELVTEACTTSTCSWPKQLWFKSQVKAELQMSATWDLHHFPFDTQIVYATIPILDEDQFAHPDTYNKSYCNVTLPGLDDFKPLFDSIYEPDDWVIYSATVKDTPDHGTLIFELKVARQSMTTVFKVLIPMLANALLIMLSASMGSSSRLTIVSLSIVGAGTMLNPSFLGLPDNTQGIPFVQSLVIIHMVVAMILMADSLQAVVIDYIYEPKVDDETKAYKKSMDDVWKSNAAVYGKWAKRLGNTLAADDVKTMELASPRLDKGDNRARVGVAPPEEPQQELQQASTDERADMQRAMVELLVALPSLFHRQDPTRPPSIWTPNKELRPGFVPAYNRHILKRSAGQRKLVWAIPLLYLTLWILDLIIYFGFQNAKK